MPAPHSPARRFAIPVIVLMLITSSLLPSKWHVYGPQVRSAVGTILWPVTAPIRSANGWLQQESPLRNLGSEDEKSALLYELDGYNRGLQQKIDRLESLLSEYGSLHATFGESFAFKRGQIIGTSSDTASGTVQLSLGTRDGVVPGLAVIDPRRLALVGRIIQAGYTNSIVQPLASPDKLVEVVVTPPLMGNRPLSPDRRKSFLLKYDAAIGFVSDDIEAQIPVKIDDLARLSDYKGQIVWPDKVQGMIVGVVSKVEPNPDKPLRQRIVVTPVRSLRRMEQVIVLVPRGTDDPIEAEAKP